MQALGLEVGAALRKLLGITTPYAPELVEQLTPVIVVQDLQRSGLGAGIPFCSGAAVPALAANNSYIALSVRSTAPRGTVCVVDGVLMGGNAAVRVGIVTETNITADWDTILVNEVTVKASEQPAPSTTQIQYLTDLLLKWDQDVVAPPTSNGGVQVQYAGAQTMEIPGPWVLRPGGHLVVFTEAQNQALSASFRGRVLYTTAKP